MQIVAPRIAPYRARIARSHAPVSRSGSLTWDRFRDCLRWELGFTCAICLLHEVHFILPGTGADRTGQMTIEHIVLRSSPEGAALANDYANCLLICRLCNGKRGHRYAHRSPGGVRLLNPIDDVWSDHFEAIEERLEPRVADADADYTCDAYGINDDMRTVRRSKMRELIEERLESVRRGRVELTSLDARLQQPGVDPNTSEWLLTDRGRRVEALRRTFRALIDLSAVPHDAPRMCRCAEPLLQVASVISETWMNVPELTIPDPPLPSRRRFRA